VSIEEGDDMDPDVDYESAMAKLRATARDFGVAAPSTSGGGERTKKKKKRVSDSLQSGGGGGGGGKHTHSHTHMYNSAPRSNRGLTSSAVSKLRLEIFKSTWSISSLLLKMV
jgi:hypothetical protein